LRDIREIIMGSERREVAIYFASLIIFITITLGILIIVRVLRLHILIEQFYLHHWFTWIGTLYIASSVPIVYYLKRKFKEKRRLLMRVHAFGNLLAVLLITLHFSTQISRSPLPELGTGLFILYPVMLLLVATGFSMQFLRPGRVYTTLKYLHTGVTITFYFTIMVHILHGLGYI
jgi:hypothetical protein